MSTRVDPVPGEHSFASLAARSQRSSHPDMSTVHLPGDTDPPQATAPSPVASPADGTTAGTSADAPAVALGEQPKGSSRKVSEGDGRGTRIPVDKEPGATKVIKRYSNRKLYDTARSKYVTLDEIARMVKAGEDVCIIDNESKEDLTSVTLTQIIYEQEKSNRRMPLVMLRDIIQTGGDTLNEFFNSSVATAQKSVGTSVTELRQGALGFKEAAARQLTELTDSARRFFSREERRAEEFKRATWLGIDQLEAKLQERVQQIRATRSALEQHGPAIGEDDAPQASVDELLERNTHTLEHVDGLRTRLTAMAVILDRLEDAARGVRPEGDDDTL